MPRNRYTLYGWHLSYFSGKTRAYLNYKQIPYVEKAVDAFTLMKRIPDKTGASVMPVVVCPDGEWLQDTTHIMELLEQRVPDRPVVPSSPRQRIAAEMLEAWADEWWIPVAMHYRWSYPENHQLFRREAGRALLPWAPGVLRNRLADFAANKMRGYLPGVGVTPDQTAVLESWTASMLDALENHLDQHDYLFGAAPTVADFALVGPLYGHLGRDPYPLRMLIEPRPRVRDWIHRVHSGKTASGNYLADDQIPETLNPLLHSVFHEFWPMLLHTRDAVRDAIPQLAPNRQRLPRSLAPIRFPMAGHSFMRNALPYSLWMWQRVQQHYRQLSPAEQQPVQNWLQQQHAIGALDTDLGPPLRRRGLHVEISTVRQQVDAA